MKNIDLCIPVYLNQSVIFDSLAIIENGFTSVKTIKSASKSEATRTTGMNAEADANLGLSNVFSLFSIGIKGNYKKEKKNENQDMESYEKIHTPTSLFFKFKEYLYENELIKKITFDDQKFNIQSGDYVEFQGNFHKNPIVESIENIKKLMDLVMIFSPESLEEDNANPGGGKKKKYHENKKPRIIQQIDGFEKALTINDMVDIIVSDENEILKCVLLCEQSYFLKSNYNLVAEGKYRVLGKIINVYQNENEKINLLRMTSMIRINKDTIKEMFSGFSNIEDSGIDLPKIETEINGPCIQIMPIGIYL